MVYSITQNIQYAPGSSDPYSATSYKAQTNIYYEYRPDESKIYITQIYCKLMDSNNQDITQDIFEIIAGVPNNGNQPYWRSGDPRQMGTIQFFVNGTEVLNFATGDYAFCSESDSKKILMNDLKTYQKSFSISSLNDVVTFKFNNFGSSGKIYDTQYSSYTYRYLRFCVTSSPEVLPIVQTYEIKNYGIIGNENDANDSTGNIRLFYEIRHYNTNEDIVYDNTLFSPTIDNYYLFYQLQIGREKCTSVTHARIGIGVDDYSSFTSNYTDYPTGNTYLKVLVNNVDVIQYLRESIYNATSQSFYSRTDAGTGRFPMYTGLTGSGTYTMGLTYSGSWYPIFDTITANNFKIIPSGLYPLTSGATINITLSCSNIYQHYGYEGGTQQGYYWFTGTNVCNQFHVPLNPGSNNSVSGLTVPAEGCIYISNGTNFEAYATYIFNGTDWEQYLPYIHNGTDWELQG